MSLLATRRGAARPLPLPLLLTSNRLPSRRYLTLSPQGCLLSHYSLSPSSRPVSRHTLPTSIHQRQTYVTHTDIETTALQVTDPLVIYRAKVARGELEEDEEQLRALVELRNINRTLRDYIPPAHLLGILHEDTFSRDAALVRPAKETKSADAEQDTPARREKIGELVKWLSESDGLAELGTPKGLMITGTPGTGKSMVMDIFYDSLPTKYKFRRHYHHLLLDLYKIIWEEAERRRIALRHGGSRQTVLPKIGTGSIWKRGGSQMVDANDPKNSQGWRRVLEGMPFLRPDSLSEDTQNLAYVPGPDGDVVKTTLPLHAAAHLFLRHGHILLFDEIQLVDVASAGLLRRTLEAYWRLGGVVIGTSNRIPKDLYASNVQRGQLTKFLEILGERCPNFEMRKTRDFRRQPFYRQEWLKRKQQENNQEQFDDPLAAKYTSLPGNRRATYFVRGEEVLYQEAVDDAIRGRQGAPATVQVYGRSVHIPFAIPASDDGPSVCRFSFSQLCDSPLGPADYLTLASTYHTFIIEKVPQLTLLQKNQARRLITLLDAVYEAGCRLVVLADSAPDDLFFPDAKEAAQHAARGAAAGPGRIVREIRDGQENAAEPDDVVDMSARGARSPFQTPPPGQGYPEEEELERRRRLQHRVDVSMDEFMTESLIQAETMSEAMQDTEEGFRPNILPYDERPDRSAGARLDEAQADPTMTVDELAREKELADKVGFKHLAIFSGEDERFAYQRAVSRLFEMSHPDWVIRKSWRPFLDGEMDSWRGSEAEKRERERERESVQYSSQSVRERPADEGDFADEASYEASTFPSRVSEPELWSEKRENDQPNRGASNAGLPADGRPSFAPGPVGRRRGEGPPVISEAHIWGVREDWGKKAGAWGKGASAFEESKTKATRKPGGSRGLHTSAARGAVVDYYRTLNVPRTASKTQIKAQFYKLSKELHPDVNPSEDAKKKFQEVSEAWATLGSDTSR